MPFMNLLHKRRMMWALTADPRALFKKCLGDLTVSLRPISQVEDLGGPGIHFAPLG